LPVELFKREWVTIAEGAMRENAQAKGLKRNGTQESESTEEAILWENLSGKQIETQQFCVGFVRG